MKTLRAIRTVIFALLGGIMGRCLAVHDWVLSTIAYVLSLVLRRVRGRGEVNDRQREA